jgi:PBP1b-binding outer membrane lipoprotein LpoB
VKYLFILFFFSSCYTAKQAEKDIDKAQEKFPEVVAKKSLEYYPCGIELIKTDTIEKIKWNTYVDSIKEVVYRFKTDTIINDCSQLKKKIKQQSEFIDGLQFALNNVPIIEKYVIINDSAKLKLKQVEIENLNNEILSNRKSFNQRTSMLIWALILFIVSLIAHLLRK